MTNESDDIILLFSKYIYMTVSCSGLSISSNALNVL